MDQTKEATFFKVFWAKFGPNQTDQIETSFQRLFSG